MAMARDWLTSASVSQLRYCRFKASSSATVRVDTGFSHQRECLSQRLQHRRDQEIAGEFYQIGLGGSVADDKSLLTHRIKQLLATLEHRVSAGGDDEKLGCRRSFRPPEHRRGDVTLTGLVMCLGQVIGQPTLAASHSHDTPTQHQCPLRAR